MCLCVFFSFIVLLFIFNLREKQLDLHTPGNCIETNSSFLFSIKGFFCKTEEEFDDLCEQINEVYFPNRTLVVELVLVAVSSCILECLTAVSKPIETSLIKKIK